MKLIREFLESYYTVRQIAPREWEVAKFAGGKAPEKTYRVMQLHASFTTDSPGMQKVGQDDKTIRLVKRFIADGQPLLAHYTFDSKNQPELHKFQPAEGDE